MFDEVIIAKLEYCLEHITTIQKYVMHISSAKEFAEKHEGLTYDGTLMRLQALCEQLKTLSQKYPEVIKVLNYPDMDSVIKFRDYASHHYERLFHEIVYDITQRDLPLLKDCLLNLLSKK